MKRFFILCAVLCIAAPAVYGFDLDELEQFEQLETLDLFNAATEAAKREDIGEAERLLDEAREKSSVRDGEDDARAAIKNAKERIAERKRQAEEKRRQEEERQRQAAQQQPSNTSRPGCVSVSGSCTSGAGCVIDNFKVTDGPGYVPADSWTSSYRTVCPGYNDALYGVYSYQIIIKNKICSGRFNMTSKAQSWAAVNVYSHSCEISFVNEG